MKNFILFLILLYSINLYSYRLPELYLDNKKRADLYKPKFILIIDDIGKSLNNAIKFWKLNPNITLSVLPYFRDSKKISLYAKKNNLPIMLHFPMEPYSKKMNFKKYYLTTEMSKKDFFKTINFVMRKVPYFQGINNHMGSKLTSNYRCMKWFFQHIRNSKKFFIDSRTSKYSIAAKISNEFGLLTGIRDIFIDNQRDEEKILIQLEKLYLLSKNKGFAIGIGHPYKETYNAIKKFLKLKKNVTILSAFEGLHRYMEFEKMLVLKRGYNENSRY